MILPIFRIACLAALSLSAAGPGQSQDLPPGLVSARLLPGWTDDQGARVAALELVLQPGWKTYWRSPGDSGLPPEFDWQDSDNLAQVTLHWPAPQAIRSGRTLSMGYHDRLVLPFTATAMDPARPVTLTATVDLGLCERICVPGHLTLSAPPPQRMADPAITAALAAVPRHDPRRPECHITPIADGVRVRVDLPDPGTTVAALELDGQPQVWVSGAEIGQDARSVTADFVPPSAQPFDLPVGALRLTLIGPDGASEMRGCDPQG